MNIKPFIKVPLVLMENVFFSLFPNSRPAIEKYIFNPYQFNEKHLAYSRNQFDNFLEKIGGPDKIKGKTILEIGPGGSIGLGILALKSGASNYCAIDYGTHTFITKKQLTWYRKLVDCDDTFIQNIFTKKNGAYYYNNSKIKFITIDQNSTYSLPDISVDLVYSCAVLEHVHNPDLCFSELKRVLRPSGIMNHQVDLRDHIFSQKSLWFLKMSDYWFDKLFKNTGGYVNRKRFSYYKNTLEKNNFIILSVDKSTTDTDGIISRKLISHYSEEDIAVISFNILVQKTNE